MPKDNRKHPRGGSRAPSAGQISLDDSHTLPEQGRGEISSDVLGSYTGNPQDGGVPVQDADDL